MEGEEALVMIDLDQDLQRQVEAAFDPQRVYSIFKSFVTVIQGQQEELAKLQKSLQDLDSTITPKINKFQDNLDGIFNELSDVDKRFDSINDSITHVQESQKTLETSIESTKTQLLADISAQDMKWSVETAPKPIPEVVEVETTKEELIELPKVESYTQTLISTSTQTEEEMFETVVEVQVTVPESAPTPRPSTPTPRPKTPIVIAPAPSTDEIKHIVVDVLRSFNITEPLQLHPHVEAPQPIVQTVFVQAPAKDDHDIEEEYHRIKHQEKEAALHKHVEELIHKRVDELLSKTKRNMCIKNLPFLTLARRAKICDELRTRGIACKTANKLKKDAEKRRLEAALSLPSRVHELAREVEELNNEVDSHKRALERIPTALRSVLPKDFRQRYNEMNAISDRLSAIGGIDTILKKINALQDAIDELERNQAPIMMPNIEPEPLHPSHSQDSVVEQPVVAPAPPTETVKLFDSRGRLLESIMRCIRAQIGPTEPDTDSAPMIEIQKQLCEIRESYVSKSELHLVFNSDEDDNVQSSESKDGEGSAGRLVHVDAVRLRKLIQALAQRLVNDSYNQFQALQMKIDPKELQKITCQLEEYTTNFVNKQLQDMNNSITDGLKKFEVDRLTPIQATFADREKAMEIIADKIRTLTESTERLNLWTQNPLGIPQEEIENILKAQMESYIGNLRYQREQQMNQYKELSNNLTTMQEKLQDRPDKGTVDQMINMVETMMKRRLGENVTGLRQSVVQIVRAVQAKAGREEVTQLISKRVNELENSIQGTIIEDASRMALATKCLACGHTSLGRSKSPNSHANTNTIDESDSISVRSDITFGSQSYHMDEDEDDMTLQQFYAIASGRVGLKPLSRQSAPYVPKTASTAATATTSPTGRANASVSSNSSHHSGVSGRLSSSSTVHSTHSEPLYLRARNAAQTREMVKIPIKIPTTPAQQNRYMLDTQYSRSTGIGGSNDQSASLPPLKHSPGGSTM